MTDQTKAVAALAEAMFGKKAGPTYCYYAEQAINAIAANPDILRSMGLGRLLTWNEFVDVILPGPVGDETSVPAGAAAERMRDAGFLRPDPDPPAPELPSVSDHIDATYKWVAARDDLEANPSPDAHRREKDAYIAMYQSVKRIHAAAKAGRSS